MSEIKEDELLTKISSYCNKVLRNDDCVDMSDAQAEALVIEAKCKGKCTWHIQWPDKYDPSLTGPRLWRYNRWVESCNKWERDKKRSDDERKARFIFEANVNKIKKHLMKEYQMDENHASVSAYQMLKKEQNNKIKMIGIEKLITTIEEIP